MKIHGLYNSVDAVSQSMLKTMRASPRKFEACYITKTLSTDATPEQELGTKIHFAILEPERFDDRYCRIPKEVLASNGHRRGKAYDEWFEEMASIGKSPMTDAEWEKIDHIRANADRNEILKTFLQNARAIEAPIYWPERTEEGEVECKGIPDLVCVKDWIIDVKTTSDLKEFGRSAGKYAYHMQAAFYLRGASIVYESAYTCFAIAVVETVAPYRVHVKQLPTEAIIVGQSMVEESLAEYCRRKKTNDWSEVDENQLMMLDIPSYFLTGK